MMMRRPLTPPELPGNAVCTGCSSSGVASGCVPNANTRRWRFVAPEVSV